MLNNGQTQRNPRSRCRWSKSYFSQLALMNWNYNIPTNIYRLLLVIALLLGITLGHYLIGGHIKAIHEIFQRLYYIPIILSSFWFGLKGGLIISLTVSLLYAPHLLLQWAGAFTTDLGKFLEIVLYNIVGWVTGILAQAKTRQTQKLEIASLRLQHSFEKLKNQANLLLHTEEQLHRAERLSALGELTAGLAHEIKNPLGAIKGVTEILKEDFPLDSERQEFMEILLKEVDRLNAVVEKFLKLSKPLPQKPQRVEINSLIQQMVLLVKKEAENRRISIEQDLAVLEEPCQLDAEQMRQVMLNIMLNSIQAMPEGGNLRINTRIMEEEDGHSLNRWLHLIFIDNGIGIPPENLEKIFNPFFTTKPNGTGLGLPITYKIIRNLTGRIEVQSEPGKGTQVTVIIPLRH